MARFFVRVEMHDATSDMYDELHRKMAAAGYHRYIQGDTGRFSQLPSAEYKAAKPFDAEQVRDQVFKIAQTLTADPWVLAVEYRSAAWQTAIITGADAKALDRVRG